MVQMLENTTNSNETQFIGTNRYATWKQQQQQWQEIHQKNVIKFLLIANFENTIEVCSEKHTHTLTYSKHSHTQALT